MDNYWVLSMLKISFLTDLHEDGLRQTHQSYKRYTSHNSNIVTSSETFPSGNLSPSVSCLGLYGQTLITFIFILWSLLLLIPLETESPSKCLSLSFEITISISPLKMYVNCFRLLIVYLICVLATLLTCLILVRLSLVLASKTETQLI